MKQKLTLSVKSKLIKQFRKYFQKDSISAWLEEYLENQIRYEKQSIKTRKQLENQFKEKETYPSYIKRLRKEGYSK